MVVLEDGHESLGGERSGLRVEDGISPWSLKLAGPLGVDVTTEQAKAGMAAYLISMRGARFAAAVRAVLVSQAEELPGEFLHDGGQVARRRLRR